MKALRYRFSSGFFIIMSLALLILGGRNGAFLDNMQSGVVDVVVPVFDVISRPLEAADNLMKWSQQIAIVFSENKRLRAENTQLRQAHVISSQLAIDNQRLKKLLNIKDGSISTIAAGRVISDSDSPFFKSVLINRGQHDGVRKGHAVINEYGIVGRIVNAGLSSSRVLLATDINSRIPVKLASNGINMILEGDNSFYPKLAFLPIGEKISLGDLVLTSGYGLVFPHDFPVGQVVEINDKDIRVELSARLYNLNYVSIIKKDVIQSLPYTQSESTLKEPE